MELKAASVDCEDGNFSRSLNDLWQLDDMNPKKGRFPCCIVWTPLPIISWLAPYIGHVGICLEDGAVLDFAGSNFVNIDNFAYGAVAKYVQLDRKQRICLATHASNPTGTPRVEQQSLGILHLTFAGSNTNTNTITCSHATATPLFPSASTNLHTMAMSGGIC